jgi:hypothetical protein
MDFQFGLGKTITFWSITPPTPPQLSFVATFVKTIMVVQGGGGGDVTTRQVHPWQLWD